MVVCGGGIYIILYCEGRLAPRPNRTSLAERFSQAPHIKGQSQSRSAAQLLARAT